MKKGVLYESGKSESGELYLGRLIFALRTVARMLSFLGLALMVISVVGIGFIYMPLGVARARYFVVSQVRRTRPDERVQVVAPQNEATETGKAVVDNTAVDEDLGEPRWEVPDWEYSINIPKILATSKVIPGVDASSASQYLAALKEGVAEARGLAHPGEVGTTYLFAHSVGSRADFARYNAVFYLLDKLEKDDWIEVVYQGKLLRYEVVKKEILEPTDVKYLVPQKMAERLVLQTCYPPGTSRKRLVIVAKRW